MNKIPLHWQIFIALIAAVIFGIIFNTKYVLDEDSLNNISLQIKDKEVIAQLKNISGKEFESKSSLINELEKILSDESLIKYRTIIIKQAYNNPPLAWISWMGDIFLRGLKMLVIPLIITSIISGITSIGTGKSLGRLGFKTVIYYLVTSLLAIINGLLLVNMISPGKGKEFDIPGEFEVLHGSQQSIKEMLVNIVPSNIFQSLVSNDLLSILFFTILVGVFILRLPPGSRNTLVNFFNATYDLFMKMTMFVILLAPLGIFGLVAKVVADQDNLMEMVYQLGKFSLTVLLALFIHSFFIIPLIVIIIGKTSIYKHFKNMGTALLTAFSTASSAATLPLTMKSTGEKTGVSQKITNFTLPIGTTVNMDGTAIYISIVVIFIAQVYGIDLAMKQQLVILLTALLASIGTAAIPMGSLILMTLILTSVGVPLQGISLIFPVDRILDMFRTTTNVWSDSCGAVVIAKTEGETFKTD
ncbi:MAG: dicarboxylate/amino acid:cation symporter [bacterium]